MRMDNHFEKTRLQHALTQEKRQYRMYKLGKIWVSAGISLVFGGILLYATPQQAVSADTNATVTTSAKTTDTTTDSTSTGATDTTASDTATSVDKAAESGTSTPATDATTADTTTTEATTAASPDSTATSATADQTTTAVSKTANDGETTTSTGDTTTAANTASADSAATTASATATAATTTTSTDATTTATTASDSTTLTNPTATEVTAAKATAAAKNAATGQAQTVKAVAATAAASGTVTLSSSTIGNDGKDSNVTLTFAMFAPLGTSATFTLTLPAVGSSYTYGTIPQMPASDGTTTTKKNDDGSITITNVLTNGGNYSQAITLNERTNYGDNSTPMTDVGTTIKEFDYTVNGIAQTPVDLTQIITPGANLGTATRAYPSATNTTTIEPDTDYVYSFSVNEWNGVQNTASSVARVNAAAN